MFSHACLVGFNHSLTHAFSLSSPTMRLFVYAFKRYEIVLRILLQHIIIKKGIEEILENRISENFK